MPGIGHTHRQHDRQHCHDVCSDAREQVVREIEDNHEQNHRVERRETAHLRTDGVGEFVGTGVDFGDHGEYGVGVRLQHISNGCIKEPNFGATLGEVRISYRWE